MMTTKVSRSDKPRNKKIAGAWITGISPDQPVGKVAARILKTRLKSVSLLLPLAAENGGENPEHVHQLRVASRRAIAALKMFADLIEEPLLVQFQESLRQIRQATDQARNLDIISAWFSGKADLPPRLLERIQAQRSAVRLPIAEVAQANESHNWSAKVDLLVQAIASQTQGQGKQEFRRVADQYLAPFVKKFFMVTAGKLGSAELLHQLRLRGKKLRYAMEIVHTAFDLSFRKKLYPQFTLMQDLLGTINDAFTALTLFREWRNGSKDKEEKAFLAGLVFAEDRALNDLRTAFLATWSPKTFGELKQKLERYC